MGASHVGSNPTLSAIRFKNLPNELEMNIDFGLVTYTERKDLTTDDRLLLKALEHKGYKCKALIWDDPLVDWQSITVTILRSAWDYHLKFERFLAWIDKVSMQTVLINPAKLLRWNIEKTYLRELSAKGLPIIPTIYLDAKQSANLFSLMEKTNWTNVIAKPSIGLSSYRAKRIVQATTSIVEGQQHIDNLLKHGDVLIQPYFNSVEKYGERNLIFINGEYSHCINKMRSPELTKKAERKFWEEHDSSAYVDWKQAKRVRFTELKPSTTAISIRLPTDLLEQIKTLANRKDVPYQSLIKLWLAEKIAGQTKNL